MTFNGSAIYQVASNLGIAPIKEVARQVGVITVLRVTAYYPSRRIRHSVATLVEHQSNLRELSIIHENLFDHKPVTINVSRENFDELLQAFVQAKFDKLSDQTDISLKDGSLWLIQKATSGYLHEIIVSPDIPQLPYSTIVNAIDAYLPEAIREVPLS